MEKNTTAKSRQLQKQLETCRICLNSTQDCIKLTEQLSVGKMDANDDGCSKDPQSMPKTYCDYFVVVTHLNLDPLKLNLPQQICRYCSVELYACYRFQQRAKEADAQLRNLATKNCEDQNEIENLYENLNARTCCLIDGRNLLNYYTSEQSKIAFNNTNNEEKSSNDFLNESSKCQINLPANNLDAYEITHKATKVSTTFRSKQDHVECKVCKRLFSATKYATHFRKVHAAAPSGFQCPKCSKHFAYRYRLKSHFEVHHGIRQKNVACGQCPRMFYSKKLLSTHMLSHEPAGIKHKCIKCGKGFQRVTGLRRHMIMHEGGREQCTECNKRFPNQAELRIHMLTHTKEMSLLCAICGQGFRRQGPFSYHMRKHRGEKYACAHCNQEFSCLSTMRRHEYIHTGLPFQCPHCMTRQATRGSLERHLKEAHEAVLTPEELRAIYSTVQNSRLQ